MSKDQAIGGAIFIVCIVVAIGYLVTLFYPNWLSMVGLAGSLLKRCKTSGSGSSPYRCS